MMTVALCIHLSFLCAKVQQIFDIRKHAGHFFFSNLGHSITQFPPDITPTGMFYVNVSLNLLNNHHQDGKRQGAVERIQDVAGVRRAAAVDVLAVEGVENIAAI